MTNASPIDQLLVRADLIKTGVVALSHHTAIRDLDEEDRQQEAHDRMWGEQSHIVIIRTNSYHWKQLSPVGKTHQQHLHERYDHFRELVRVLVRGRVEQVQQEFKDADDIVAQFIIQEVARHRTVAEEVTDVSKAIDSLLSLVAANIDASDRRPVIVPDTNSLIFNPQIENWSFEDVAQFRLVIMPTVLQELDQLKVTGRVDTLRDKADRVIRQLKEYRRRGSLHEGVTIKKDTIELIAVPIDPEMSETLPWLKESNADDRLIASTLEIMRKYPHSPVILVTRDINAQNKADFAGIAFMEPPDPVNK